MSFETHAIYGSSASQAASRSLSQSVKGLWRAYWERRARKASIFLLSSLDNRTLEDIGMHRSEIELFVYNKSKERLRRYEASWE